MTISSIAFLFLASGLVVGFTMWAYSLGEKKGKMKGRIEVIQTFKKVCDKNSAIMRKIESFPKSTVQHAFHVNNLTQQLQGRIDLVQDFLEESKKFVSNNK